jgi:hypothetical protein
MEKYEQLISGQALLKALKSDKNLFKEFPTNQLYTSVAQCNPILGGIIHLKQNDDDRLLKVIDLISIIREEPDETPHRMISLIDCDKAFRSSTTFRECVIGFLEQKLNDLSEDIDRSAKNAHFEFLEEVEFSSKIEKMFIQFVIVMFERKELNAFFDVLVESRGGNSCDEDAEDYAKKEYQVFVAEAISIVLDIAPEELSEILRGDLVSIKHSCEDRNVFTLHKEIVRLLYENRFISH